MNTLRQVFQPLRNENLYYNEWKCNIQDKEQRTFILANNLNSSILGYILYGIIKMT